MPTEDITGSDQAAAGTAGAGGAGAGIPVAVALSPHLDDAVFSAGGTLARLIDAGWRVRLVTVLTATVPRPAGFALACQLDKGLSAEVDYMALRRAEDRRAAAALGCRAVDVMHLPLPEAPHRGYGSAAALFAGIQENDPLPAATLAQEIAPWLTDADLLLHPLGLGGHVDHLLVNAAVDRLAYCPPRLRWRDTPYVLREPGQTGAVPQSEAARGRDGGPSRGAWWDVEITATLPRKLSACAAYATQLGFQFGGESAMREALTGLARAEAEASVTAAIGATVDGDACGGLTQGGGAERGLAQRGGGRVERFWVLPTDAQAIRGREAGAGGGSVF